jgi:hypothetical protein
MVGENLIAIDMHTSEFIEHEGCAVLADASLHKNDRSRALEPKRDRNHNEGWKKNYNRRQGDRKIHHNL